MTSRTQHQRARPPATRRVARWLGRLTAGEAGQGTAWVLAAAALLAAFLATAAPRESAATSTTALDRTLEQLPPASAGLIATAGWLVLRGDAAHQISTADVSDLPKELAGLMRPPLRMQAGQAVGGFAASPAEVLNPAKSAMTADTPPTIEIVYRADPAAHLRLLSGKLPGRVIAGPGKLTTVQVAVSPANAARFQLRVGSDILLSSKLRLVVTAIIAPQDPASAYWTLDPVPAVPSVAGIKGTTHYIGGALITAPEVIGLQNALAGEFVQGSWYVPIDLHGITGASLPGLLRGISGLISAPLAAQLGPTLPRSHRQFTFEGAPSVSSPLPAAMSTFSAQQDSAAAIGSLIIVGLLAAALILLLVCAGLAADAYSGELVLLRARGASTRQAFARVLGRACLVAGPAVLVGAGLAVFLVPAGGLSRPWLPGLLVAIAAIGAPAALAAWQHRRARLPGSERGGAIGVRRSPRRTVAEATVIILAAGALAVLRLRGSSGQADAFTSASPVLAALAASLLAARLYPLPVRSLLKVAAARPGAVGFVGLARAARARGAAVLPALALVLTMTMAAFAAMLSGSVAAGQDAAAWQQVGADVSVTATGNNVIGAKAQHAIAALPGVAHETAVYTASTYSPLAAQLSAGSSAGRSVGLAVVNPAQYEALSKDTPWPDFQARLLARGAAGPGRVPVFISRTLAGAMGVRTGSGNGSTGVLELDGERLQVRFQATIGDTPAEGSGGLFVLLPTWEAAALPSIPGPNVLLATGSLTSSALLRRTVAAAVPGGGLQVRREVLASLRNSPAQAAADKINTLGLWAAGGLTAVAILLGLGASARSRRALAGRMAALGMAARQSWALALTETLPLLAIGVLGMLVAAVGLGLLIGPALNLAVFATGSGFVPVQPHLFDLLLPAAGCVIVALAVVGIQSMLTLRREAAAGLRQEEAG